MLLDSRFRRSRIAIFFACLLGFISFGNTIDASEKPKAKAYELGALIALLIPAPQEKLTWEFALDSDIRWVTSGFEETRHANGERIAVREGQVDVNVLGKKLDRAKENTGSSHLDRVDAN